MPAPGDGELLARPHGHRAELSYSFSGALSGCQSSDQTAPTGGTVSAGRVETAPSGERFQEPVPTGNGSCGSGTMSGMQVITTRYAGGHADGSLAFEADAAQCASSGVTSAGIAGVVTVTTS